MMTTKLFVIANVKQLRTGGSFRVLLHFFRTSWNVGVLNSAIFNSFHNRFEFGTILEPPPHGTPLAVSVGRTETCKEKLCSDLLLMNRALINSLFAKTAKMNPLFMETFMEVLC